MAAESAARAGQCPQALEILENEPLEVDGRFGRRAERVRLDCHTRLGQFEAAFKAWPGSDTGSRDFATWLDENTSPEQRLEAAPSLAGAASWRGQLWLDLATAASVDGGSRGAIEIARRLVDDPATPSEVRAVASELVDRLSLEIGVDFRTLGVVLPLSGSYRKVGERALRALQLAAEHSAFAGKLDVRDSRAEPERAATEARALIVEGKAGAIIGPVGTRESRLVAEQAAELGATAVLLSSRTPHNLPSRGAVWPRVTPADEVRALVRASHLEMGCRRFAVLRQDGQYGEAMAAALRAEVEDAGLEFVVDVSVSKEPKRWSKELAALAGGGSLHGSDMPFDALLLPVAPKYVSKLLPFLLSLGLEVERSATRPGAVALLGTASWRAGDVVDRVTGATEGALFAGAFDPEARGETGLTFALEFEARFAAAPTDFEAEVFDAAVLLMRSLDQLSLNPDAVRADLTPVLQEQSSTYAGLTGPLRMGVEYGAADVRPVPLFTVRAGEVVRWPLGDPSAAHERAPVFGDGEPSDSLEEILE